MNIWFKLYQTRIAESASSLNMQNKWTFVCYYFPVFKRNSDLIVFEKEFFVNEYTVQARGNPNKYTLYV